MLNWNQTWNTPWRRAALAALVCGALTWLCAQTRLYDLLANWSYDGTFLFRPGRRPEDLLLIYMDEKSSLDLHQTKETWDRGLHARLLDRLRQDGARLVVFDVWFDESGSSATNHLLAEAMHAQSAVVIAGVTEEVHGLGVGTLPVRPPALLFREAAAAWGIAAVVGDDIARQYHPGTERDPSLPWAAARLLDPDLARTPALDLSTHWLCYYGPPGCFRSLSYSDALDQPPRYFAGQVVFVGSRFNTPYPGVRRDEFRTPYTHWKPGYTPGVDLAATAFQNLRRREWLTRLGDRTEEWLMVALAAALGLGLGRLRFPTALGAALTLAPGAALLGALGVVHLHLWTPWLLVPLFQLPAALGWLVLCRPRVRPQPMATPVDLGTAATRQEMVERMEATGSAGSAALAPTVASSPVTRAAPVISDHTMLRGIGRGAYGEVWLARDVIGSFHAVKVIFRSSFDSQAPFEREYHGMQKFTPLSRNHPGWIHILHVGRNDREGYFFYVMELADDEVSGQEIVPERYQPRNLANELKKRGRLPLRECVEIGIALAEALDYLHGQLLVHRDIKPSNVIYVHGAPKFTDVGLVTEVRNRDRDVSMLGTEGYMAPEGPGAASADLYSLGKLLYEISTGRDRFAFPDVPESMVAAGSSGLARRWHELIARACHEDPARRPASAADLRDELLALRAATD